MIESPSKKFYQNIDRDKVYTTAIDVTRHPFHRQLASFVAKWDLRQKKCLEVGSSKGLFQDLVAEYIGLDVTANLAKYYHKKFVVASGDHLPFPNESFHGIFTYATYEHIPNLEAALQEVVRVLKPGGVCLFAPAWHTRPWFAKGYHMRPYSKLSVSEKFIKISIPLRDMILVRWPRVFCRRVLRLGAYLMRRGRPASLKYEKLKPNYEVFWHSDSDACNSMDPFDVIVWFKSRGIICHGYESYLGALLVRTQALELRKGTA